MNLDDLTFPSAKDDFLGELMKYHAKQPYDAGHILQYVVVCFARYSADNTLRSELDQCLRLALKPVNEALELSERNEISYKAAYVAATERAKVAESRVLFWRSVSYWLAVTAVAWAVIRAGFYLYPLLTGPR